MMSVRKTSFLALFLALAATAGFVPTPSSADEPKPETPKKDDAPPTAVAEKGPFTVIVEGSGVFDAIGAVEVAYKPDVYAGDLKVVEAAAPGPVEKGQMLVRFDTEKIDEQLAFAEKDLEIARRALAQRREESKRSEEGASLAMQRAEKDRAATQDALDLFVKVDRDRRVKEAEHRLQGARDGIADQEEELAQLRKMYKADDVVEETESIVMKRAERSLARSKTWLAFQEQRNQEMVELDLPRELQNLELNAKRTAFDLDRMRATSPIALEQGRIDLAKAEFAFDKQERAFAKLRTDREGLTLSAPVAGLALPGALSKGKWSAIDETIKGLVPGESLRAKQGIFTILTPGKVSFRTSVPEASILSVKPGQTMEIACPALGDAPAFKGKVTRVAATSADGAYEVLVEVASGTDRVMPGFSGKSKLVTAEKSDAITVPAGAVVTDGDKKIVHVFADGKSSPRTVKVGATSLGRTEVVEGLAAGEKILTSPPKP